MHGQIFTKVFVHMYLGLKELLRNERNIQRKNNSIIIKTMLKSSLPVHLLIVLQVTVYEVVFI